MPNIADILAEAKQAGASDVHITVGIPPKMRINGKLVTMANYNKLVPADTLEVVLNIMSETQRNQFEEQGEYDMSFSIPEIGRYRVNVYKQRGSIALAFRLVGTKIPTLEELGLPLSAIDLCSRKKGLILVTGPAGSGKTTTLAAMIDRMNQNKDAHIITLEDPIEYLHQHKSAMVNQREIGLDSDNYAGALHAALREDPDIILVGEMHDMETISEVITAAETGHLVLSSLHTIGAQSTLDRIIEVFPPYQHTQLRMQLSNMIEAVICQQLIPTLNGQGRVAAFEVMQTNHEIRNVIREGNFQQLLSVMQANRKDASGNAFMITMDDAIMQLYFDGKISMDMAILYAQDPEGMAQKIR